MLEELANGFLEVNRLLNTVKGSNEIEEKKWLITVLFFVCEIKQAAELCLMLKHAAFMILKAVN